MNGVRDTRALSRDAWSPARPGLVEKLIREHERHRQRRPGRERGDLAQHPQARSDLRPALGEGVQAGPEEDVLGDAPAGLLGGQFLDETGAGHDGRPEAASAVRVHVRAGPPAVAGSCQPQADLILEHVRRGVDQDVHRPP
jgi:hypothetical protein